MNDDLPQRRRPPHTSRTAANNHVGVIVAVVATVISVIVIFAVTAAAGESREERQREENYEACLADPDGWDSTGSDYDDLGGDDWNEEDSLLEPEDLCDIYPGRPD